MQSNWIELATAIVTAAGIIAGALKLLARALVKAINGHAEETKALRAVTAAQIDETRLLRQALETARKARGVVVLALALFCFAGCAATDPLIQRALERNEEVWEQDRRPDLHPELVKSRKAEFKAQQDYAKAPK